MHASHLLAGRSWGGVELQSGGHSRKWAGGTVYNTAFAIHHVQNRHARGLDLVC
jgi:hypothetical protein